MPTEQNKDIADRNGGFDINIHNVCTCIWMMRMKIHCTGTKSSPDVTIALFVPSCYTGVYTYTFTFPVRYRGFLLRMLRIGWRKEE